MEEKNQNPYLIFTVCALGLFIDGYDLYVAALAEPFIRASFHPSPFMLGLIQSSALLGAVFGSIIMGRVADLLGRQSMLLINVIFFVFVAILSSLSWDPYSLCFFRFLIGLGVGADYPIVAAYMAEMTVKVHRAKSMAIVMFINCLASPIVALIAWGVFYCYPQLNAWRVFFAIGALPALISVYLRYRIPESVAWRAIKQCAKTNNQYQRLFIPPLAKKTFILCGAWFLMDISSYGIGLFTPSILASLHINSHADLLTDASGMIMSTLVINSFIMLGAFVSIFVINRYPTVNLQKYCFLFSALGLFMMSVINTQHLSLIFLGFILFNFFLNVGPGITTYYLPTMAYPPEIRASGHGLASGIAKSGAFIGTLTLPLLESLFGIQATLGILSITLVIAYVLTNGLEDKQLTSEEKDNQDEIFLNA